MSYQKRSLELLVVEGEQESKIKDGKTYFIYELLMPSGKWFEKKGFFNYSIGSPRLPTDPHPLGQILKESGIIRDGGGSMGELGFDETCPVLLYIPGETSQQAQECLDQYRDRMDEILDSSHQHCVFKVRPVIVGKHKYKLPWE